MFFSAFYPSWFRPVLFPGPNAVQTLAFEVTPVGRWDRYDISGIITRPGINRFFFVRRTGAFLGGIAPALLPFHQWGLILAAKKSKMTGHPSPVAQVGQIHNGGIWIEERGVASPGPGEKTYIR
jgi:hypothetical protein